MLEGVLRDPRGDARRASSPTSTRPSRRAVRETWPRRDPRTLAPPPRGAHARAGARRRGARAGPGSSAPSRSPGRCRGPASAPSAGRPSAPRGDPDAPCADRAEWTAFLRARRAPRAARPARAARLDRHQRAAHPPWLAHRRAASPSLPRSTGALEGAIGEWLAPLAPAGRPLAERPPARPRARAHDPARPGRGPRGPLCADRPGRASPPAATARTSPPSELRSSRTGPGAPAELVADLARPRRAVAAAPRARRRPALAAARRGRPRRPGQGAPRGALRGRGRPARPARAADAAAGRPTAAVHARGRLGPRPAPRRLPGPARSSGRGTSTAISTRPGSPPAATSGSPGAACSTPAHVWETRVADRTYRDSACPLPHGQPRPPRGVARRLLSVARARVAPDAQRAPARPGHAAPRPARSSGAASSGTSGRPRSTSARSRGAAAPTAIGSPRWLAA